MSRSARLFHPGRFRSAWLFHPGWLLGLPARLFNDRPLLHRLARFLSSRRLLGRPSLFLDRWSDPLIWPRLGLSWWLDRGWLLTCHRPVHGRSWSLGAVRLAIRSGRDGCVRSVRYARPLEKPGARRCCHRWLAMILLGEKRTILARCLDVLPLHGRRLYVALPGDRLLLRRGPGKGASVAAVEAYIVGSVIHHHRLVIDVGNVHVFDVVDRAVVEEVAVIPAAARIAFAGVTETVVYSAVESDFAPPITGMEEVSSQPQ